MGIKKELGQRIKQLRIKNGFTQDKLSEMLNISQRALSSIEAGENFVTSNTIDSLLKAFNITAEDLFATNCVKNSEELIAMINKNIEAIGDNPQKLEIIYNITKSLKNY